MVEAEDGADSAVVIVEDEAVAGVVAVVEGDSAVVVVGVVEEVDPVTEDEVVSLSRWPLVLSCSRSSRVRVLTK